MEVIFGTSIIGIIILIGWLNHLRHQKYRIATQAKTERFNKLIDRFENDRELMQYLQSEKGLRILETLTAVKTGTRSPIIVATAIGVFFLFISMAAFILFLVEDDDFIFGALFMSMTGVGILAAAAVSYFLSVRWGLFEHDDREQVNEQFTQTGQ